MLKLNANYDAYEYAKEKYKLLGVDTEEAIVKLQNVSISMHCWQGDDVGGFDSVDSLSGGIVATGNYPGRARTPKELMDDIDVVLSLLPGKHRINLHAMYAVFEEGEYADRDKLEPKNFSAWVDFAKRRGLKLDFNPSFFSHPKAKGLTLSSPNEEIRKFWIDHAIACVKISEYFAKELDDVCLLNIWIPDGLKEIPADRLSPRKRFADSLDKIISVPYDKSKVYISLESKVFGVGFESYTVGSSEFCVNYAASRGILSLMDSGHYHPTENVADKIPSMLLFSEKIALHVTRPVRWDSDHVVILDDDTKEIAKEIIRCDALDRVFLALDFFDASINRVAAWTIGMRNMQKALLIALLTPHKHLQNLQDSENFTEMLATSEELKLYPFGEVWAEFCRRSNVEPNLEYLNTIKKYEQDVLLKRV